APWIILVVTGGVMFVLGGLMVLVSALGGNRARDTASPDDLTRNRERLIGKWTALLQERPRREFTYEFHADGTFVLIGSDGAGRQVTSSGTWKPVSAKGDTIMVRADGPEAHSEMNIEFVGMDNFRYTTPKGIVLNASRVR